MNMKRRDVTRNVSSKSGFLCTVFTVDRNGMRNLVVKFVIIAKDEEAARAIVEHSIPPAEKQFVEIEYILIFT